jgi:acetoin utilization protein AcuB
MRLQDIMSSPVETIGPGAKVAEARSTMKRQGIHHMVVTSGRRIRGIVSTGDLTRVSSDEPVERVMSAPVVTASPSTTVRQAANILRGRPVGCLPVVEADRLVGMVTISDLLELLGKGAERPIERTTAWTLRGRGARKTRPTKDRRGLAYAR